LKGKASPLSMAAILTSDSLTTPHSSSYHHTMQAVHSITDRQTDRQTARGFLLLHMIKVNWCWNTCSVAHL